MSDAQQFPKLTPEYVEVLLDKPRKLRMRYSYLERVETEILRLKASGMMAPTAGDALTLWNELLQITRDETGQPISYRLGSAWGLHLFLWAALHEDEPTITLDTVVNLIDAHQATSPQALLDLATAVRASWSVGGLGTAADAERPNVAAEATVQ